MVQSPGPKQDQILMEFNVIPHNILTCLGEGEKMGSYCEISKVKKKLTLNQKQV
jgi:hypothetical protein